MSKITPGLLNDTLNLIQLARETALAQGKATQAERLSPVVNKMRNLVTSAHEPQTTSLASNGSKTTPPVAQPMGASTPTGVFTRTDFHTLLEAARTPASTAVKQASASERGQMVVAMAAGNMNELAIARQLGMTRDEVRLILNVAQKSKPKPESFQ